MPGTVTVALKHPHGLVCRLHEIVEMRDPLPGGGTTPVMRARPTGQMFKLNGYLKPARGNEPPPPALPGAFALTHNVDKDLFDEWMRQNQDLDLVKNKLIFASDKPEYAQKKADEREELKCGLEPIDRDHLPRGISNAERKVA